MPSTERPTSEKKRKQRFDKDAQFEKRQKTSNTVSVRHVTAPNLLKAVVATSPSTNTPSDLAFQSFSDKSSRPTRLLLHSSAHPTIDYTAVEGGESNSHLFKHYIAVYNPTNATLTLTEARKVAIRGSLRPHARVEEPDGQLGHVAGSRAALTEAFGSKKGKKAAAILVENRMLGQGQEAATITKAILSNIQDDSDLDQPSAAALMRASKPLPQPNLSTQEIGQVYSLSSLVHPSPHSNTLGAMNTGQWTSRLMQDKGVKYLRTRFVANRLDYLGALLRTGPSDASIVLQFQLLRYITLLVEVHKYIGTLPRRRPVPDPSAWPTTALSTDTPSVLLPGVISHFFPDRTVSERGITLLRATILALTLHISPPNRDTNRTQLVTNPTDIALDLGLKPDEARKLLTELGCKVKPATDAELTRWGFEKTPRGSDEKRQSYARLSFPLEFPKISMGRKVRERR